MLQRVQQRAAARATRHADLVFRLPCLVLGLAGAAAFATWAPLESLPEAQRRLEETDVSMYPDDKVDGKPGAWVLYLMGVLYMFIALSIICDEYFVPALGVMGRVLKLPPDVAGATLMAAGGSAPELFTSFVGVYIAKSQVGFGTIVGSAVFNVLFVIGACAAVASKTKEGFLKLTWWPLFRDSVCYAIGLIALVLSFRDEEVQWWESALLFGMYVGYVIISKHSQELEASFKSWLRARGWMAKEDDEEGEGDEEGGANPMFQGVALSKDVLFSARQLAHRVRQDSLAAQQARRFSGGSGAGLGISPAGSSARRLGGGGGGGSRRTSVLQASNLAMLGGGGGGGGLSAEESQERVAAQKKKAMRRNTASIELANTRSKLQELESLSAVAEDAPLADVEAAAVAVPAMADSQRVKVLEHMLEDIRLELDSRMDSIESSIATVLERQEANSFFPSEVDSQGARFMYVVQWPLNYVLSLTLVYIEEPEDDEEIDEDAPLEGNDRYFLYTFIGSIAWIGFFSFYMVWWASLLGNAWGISDVVMGVTILAAGTSVPDLASSMIVTRQGEGDMAVSSSIGSNIFDILVGLPVPWCTWSLINGEAITVASDGLFTSVLVLFAMLVLVICSIAYSNWQLGFNLGVMMFSLYVLFVIQHLAVEYEWFG